MSSYQSHTDQQSSSSTAETYSSGKDSSKPTAEEWSAVKDPNERRKIQNKLAQRRFRDKVREQKEEAEREIENQRQAGSSYASPQGEQLEPGHNLSGLPWGGLSIGHIVQSGKTRDQSSQRSSRETSVYAAASRTGGSSRIGLRLTDQFARGYPAWRYFPYRRPS